MGFFDAVNGFLAMLIPSSRLLRGFNLFSNRAAIIKRLFRRRHGKGRIAPFSEGSLIWKKRE